MTLLPMRALKALLLPVSMLLASLVPAMAEQRVTDILGREVVLEQPAQRIVLGEGRHLSVLGMLMEDPVERVVGWRLDKALDAPSMDAWRNRFPQLDALQPVGSGNRDLSVESVIALDPDLVVLSLMDKGDPGMERAREQMEAAGIAVAYVDFFAHPIENSIPSLKILAALTGTEARAEAFAAFHDSRLSVIRERLAAAPDLARPSVFFHVHAAPSNCCATVGSGVFQDFITLAGGRNVAAEALDNVLGNVSLEFVLAADPDFYIATGGAHMAQRGGLVLGTGVSTEEAKASFESLTAAPGFSALHAVEEGRARGVWHLFNDTPSHIALIEYLAQTFHPELFADLDPAATLAETDNRFLTVTVPGTWWVAPN